MKVTVEVHASVRDLDEGRAPLKQYTMNHDNKAERRVLGEQCRYAFEAGQAIVTYPA